MNKLLEHLYDNPALVPFFYWISAHLYRISLLLYRNLPGFKVIPLGLGLEIVSEHRAVKA